jgi:uncharacterized protein (TIGR03435 family)
MRVLGSVTRVAMAAVIAWVGISAQEPGPRFEVASVKPNVGRDLSIPFRTPPLDGVTLTNNPLDSIIRYAYSVQPFRLEGVPEWTRNERYDIAAKAAGTISDTDRRLMMRALLVERFRLKAHFEMRDKTIYVMTLSRADKQLGPGLKPRPECEKSPCDRFGGGKEDSVFVKATTLTDFANGMLSALRGELVRDETGVPGTFDIEMSWRPETSTDPNDGRPAFVTAMREQLGLKLEPQRRPVEVLVVESIDRPTPD